MNDNLEREFDAKGPPTAGDLDMVARLVTSHLSSLKTGVNNLTMRFRG